MSALEARLDSLVATYEELDARWQPIGRDLSQVDLDEVSTLDSTMVGVVRVIAPTDLLESATAAVEVAFASLAEVLGDDRALEGLRGQRFYGFSDHGDRVTATHELKPFHLASGWAGRGVSPAMVEVRAALNAVLPAPILAWAGDRVLDPALTDGHGREQVLQIQSPLATTCIIGRDVGDCATLFDIDFSNTREQRVAFIEAVFPRDVWPRLVGSRSLYPQMQVNQACVAEDTDYDACLELLTDPIHRGTVQAMPQAVRARLLQTAILMGGGTPAWDRVDALPAGATPREALEAASGQSAERVIEAWLTGFLTARPRTALAGSGASTRLAGMWIVLLAGFSLFSTRWRLQ